MQIYELEAKRALNLLAAERLTEAYLGQFVWPVIQGQIDTALKVCQYDEQLAQIERDRRSSTLAASEDVELLEIDVSNSQTDLARAKLHKEKKLDEIAIQRARQKADEDRTIPKRIGKGAKRVAASWCPGD